MKEIPGYPDYQVTEDGRVWSKRKQGFLTPRKTNHGYLSVALYANGLRNDIGIHRLVMWAYVGPQPEQIEVRHKNGVRNDNRLNNLGYGTRSDNAKDRVAHGNNHQTKGERNGRSKLTQEQVDEIKVRLAHGEMPRLIAPDYNVKKLTIERIRNQSTWV